jgi:hypothetical protein
VCCGGSKSSACGMRCRHEGVAIVADRWAWAHLSEHERRWPVCLPSSKFEFEFSNLPGIVNCKNHTS